MVCIMRLRFMFLSKICLCLSNFIKPLNDDPRNCERLKLSPSIKSRPFSYIFIVILESISSTTSSKNYLSYSSSSAKKILYLLMFINSLLDSVQGSKYRPYPLIMDMQHGIHMIESKYMNTSKLLSKFYRISKVASTPLSYQSIFLINFYP